MHELNICEPCRIKQGFKRKDNGCHTAVLSNCSECGNEGGILANRHWKQINAPLKEDLREELATAKNTIKQLEYELDKLREKLVTEQEMLNLAWDAIGEAGYEGHCKELNDYINN